jgi:hypothetical protein
MVCIADCSFEVNILTAFYYFRNKHLEQSSCFKNYQKCAQGPAVPRGNLFSLFVVYVNEQGSNS